MVEIMLNSTVVKENDMNLTPMKLFNNMTDEDFYFLHEEGELKSFCDALSLDLHRKDEPDRTFTA
jgi:hypothetical protein